MFLKKCKAFQFQEICRQKPLIFRKTFLEALLKNQLAIARMFRWVSFEQQVYDNQNMITHLYPCQRHFLSES